MPSLGTNNHVHGSSAPFTKGTPIANSKPFPCLKSYGKGTAAWKTLQQPKIQSSLLHSLASDDRPPLVSNLHFACQGHTCSDGFPPGACSLAPRTASSDSGAWRGRTALLSGPQAIAGGHTDTLRRAWLVLEMIGSLGALLEAERWGAILGQNACQCSSCFCFPVCVLEAGRKGPGRLFRKWRVWAELRPRCWTTGAPCWGT